MPLCVCHSQAAHTHTHSHTENILPVTRLAFSSAAWLVGTCSFPCRGFDTHSLWRTQHSPSLSLFSPLRLSPDVALTVVHPRPSPPHLPVTPVVSNYHSSVSPQPLHYVRAVITVCLQYLPPILRPDPNRKYLFDMTKMTRLNKRLIDSPIDSHWKAVFLLSWFTLEVM